MTSEDNFSIPVENSVETGAPVVPENWVEIAVAAETSQAVIIVDHLRACGITAKTQAEQANDQAPPDPVETVSILVAEHDVAAAQVALGGPGQGPGENDEESPSDLSRTILGFTAVAVNPLGAAIAYGLSKLPSGQLEEE